MAELINDYRRDTAKAPLRAQVTKLVAVSNIMAFEIDRLARACKLAGREEEYAHLKQLLETHEQALADMRASQ